MNRIDDEQFQRLESLLLTFRLRARNKYEESRIASECAKELEVVCGEIEREISHAKQQIQRENEESWKATIERHQQNS
jgi:hypothetical protein